MKTYEFHSALPPEKILARLHTKTRRWTRLDGWTSRNTWFLAQRRNGTFRLILTGPGYGYVFADLALSKAADGADISAAVSAAKTYILNIVLVVLLVLLFLISVLLRDIPGGLRSLLGYGWVLPLTVWTGSLTRRRLPELVKFIEENLLE